MVRNGNNPLAQIVKRLHEAQVSKITNSHPYQNPFNTNGKDCFFLSQNDYVCEIKNVTEDGYECDVIKKELFDSLYEKPVCSKQLNIYLLKNKNTSRKHKLMSSELVKRKLIKFPYKNSFVFFPLSNEREI